MRAAITLALQAALLSATGCSHSLRAGILAVSDEHGRMGALATFAYGVGLTSRNPGPDVTVLATLALRGGVLDARPSGYAQADAGVDVITSWERLAFRAGGFVGLGGQVGSRSGVGVTPGARFALSGLLRSTVRPVTIGNRGEPLSRCFLTRTHHLGVEVGAAYAFGPGRAQFTFGPMYEWMQVEDGECGVE